MGDEVIEAIECMKSWKKAGLISEKPFVAVETTLRDLEEGAQSLGQGSEMGSGCSELGSDITGSIG